MKLKLFAFAIACGFTMSFVSCGSGDPCTATSKCSADPKPTDADIKACQDANKTGAKCATELTALTTCTQANQVCGSDNKTDGAATAAKCTSQTTAYTTCLLGSITGDGGTP